MDVNDKPLSAGEHEEMRTRLVGAARRSRVARRRVARVATVSVAFALIFGVVTTGLVVAVEARNTPKVASTASPTPPGAAVAPFGGDCGSVVDPDLLDEVLGGDAREDARSWQLPQVSLAGVIDCKWSDPDMHAALWVAALPAGDGDVEAGPSCGDPDGPGSCSAWLVENGTFLRISVARSGLDPTAFGDLVSDISANLARFDSPHSAVARSTWWKTGTCDDLDAAARPAGADATRGDPIVLAVARPEDPRTYAGFTTAIYAHVYECEWIFEPASGNPSDTGSVTASVVPGGGVYFDDIAASAGAEAVTLPGGRVAVFTAPPTHDARRAGGSTLVVPDGDNLLMLASWQAGPSRAQLVDMVEPFLTYLDAGLD